MRTNVVIKGEGMDAVMAAASMQPLTKFSTPALMEARTFTSVARTPFDQAMHDAIVDELAMRETNKERRQKA